MSNLMHARDAVSSAIVKVRGENSLPSVSIKSYELVGKGLARITALVSHASGSQVSSNLIKASIADKFQNKLHCISSSFIEVDSDSLTSTVTGVVYEARESIPYSESMQGFRSLSSNMFMDEDDDIWSLRKSEAGEFLIKTSSIDNGESLRVILDGSYVSTSSSETKDFRDRMSAVASSFDEANGGDMVTFVSSRTDTVDFGIIIASVIDNETGDDKVAVLRFDQNECEVIDRGALVSVASSSQFPLPEIDNDSFLATAAAEPNIENLVAYYKRIFGHAPEYFKRMEQIIRNHAFM